MTSRVNSFPWATVMLGVLVAVAALVGGAVVVWGPAGALSFTEYLTYMKDFAYALGVLAVGRGINSGLRNHGLGDPPADAGGYDPAGAELLGGDLEHYGDDPAAVTTRKR